MYIIAQGSRLRNDVYCVELDVKLYYTIPYPGRRELVIVLVYCILSFLWHDICVLPWPYVIHFLLGMISPICAESAVTPTS